MLSDHCISCPVCDVVYSGQMVGWIKMPLGMEVGQPWGSPGCIVLDGDRAPCLLKGAQHHPHFSTLPRLTTIDMGPVHIYCDQTALWFNVLAVVRLHIMYVLTLWPFWSDFWPFWFMAVLDVTRRPTSHRISICRHGSGTAAPNQSKIIGLQYTHTKLIQHCH